MKPQKLSAVSIRRLRRVRDAIRANPELYDQDQTTCANKTCGTTACILGWANTLYRKVSTARVVTAEESWWGYNARAMEICSTAARASLARGTAVLDLTAEQAERLWFSDKWPDRYVWSSGHSVRGGNARERASTAAKRITHFIKTGGEK